jgi:hypothetical protein
MKPSDKVIGRLYALYQTGLSLEQVGKKHGTTRQNIHKLFKKHGLQRRSKRAAGRLRGDKKQVQGNQFRGGRKFGWARPAKSHSGEIAATIYRGGTTDAPCLTTRMKRLA